MGILWPFAVLTVISAGGGFVFAQQILAVPPANQAVPKLIASEHGVPTREPTPAEATPGAIGELLALPPIITNLAQPSEAYIRLEGSILVEPGYSGARELAAKVSEDVITLLRTTALQQIQGSAGLNHLREDINDRVRIRSEGKARELIINTLVIE